MNSRFVACRAADGVVAATFAVDDLRRAFYDEWAQGDRYWWWIRMIFLDPNELIVDDGEDNLYRMSWSVENDQASFGEPQPVRIEYVDIAARSEAVAAAADAMASVRDQAQIAARYNSREGSRPTASSEGGSMTPEQIAAARTLLGLGDDVTDEQVVALAQPLLVGQTGAEGGDDPTPGTDDPDGTGDGSGEPAPDTAPAPESAVPAVARANGTVAVDQQTLAQLQADAQAGREARAIQLRVERENFVDAAIRSGKFGPGRREHWLNALTRDPVGARADIDSLADGLVPVEQHAVQPQGEGVATSGYPASWLPDVQVRNARIQAQAARGEQPRVVTDAA